MTYHDTPETGLHARRTPARHCLRRMTLGLSGFAAMVILVSWIVFGSIILLGSIGVLTVGISELWPVILVLVGANLILTSGRYRQRPDVRQTDSDVPPMA